MGDLKVWDDAEATLRAVLEEKMPGQWDINEEDAAFYGPKVSLVFLISRSDIRADGIA